jgi:hypothetical protein
MMMMVKTASQRKTSQQIMDIVALREMHAVCCGSEMA